MSRGETPFPINLWGRWESCPQYSSVIGRMGRGEIPSPTPLPEVGELLLSFIICSTWESSPNTSTGQQSRSGQEGVGVGEPPLRM